MRVLHQTRAREVKTQRLPSRCQPKRCICYRVVPGFHPWAMVCTDSAPCPDCRWQPVTAASSRSIATSFCGDSAPPNVYCCEGATKRGAASRRLALLRLAAGNSMRRPTREPWHHSHSASECLALTAGRQPIQPDDCQQAAHADDRRDGRAYGDKWSWREAEFGPNDGWERLVLWRGNEQ